MVGYQIISGDRSIIGFRGLGFRGLGFTPKDYSPNVLTKSVSDAVPLSPHTLAISLPCHVTLSLFVSEPQTLGWKFQALDPKPL